MLFSNLLEAAGSGSTYYGQQVYILGFPHGHDSGGAEINRGLPIPFVKSGVISAFAFGDVKKIYIDTHANEGFSGGPVVFRPQQGGGIHMNSAWQESSPDISNTAEPCTTQMAIIWLTWGRTPVSLSPLEYSTPPT